jgi:hypothetical protein
VAAFVSVYRNVILSPHGRGKVARAAEEDPALRKYLEEYDESYFDWGDDPSFFAAQEHLGDVRRASWGVCRRNLRRLLVPGDLVIFFCVRQCRRPEVWHYYYIGFGTVRLRLTRWCIWQDPKFASYQSFYNLLVRPHNDELVHAEVFPEHKDFEDRLPDYILFDPREGRTEFDLKSPPRVATFFLTIPEVWNLSHPFAAELHELLMEGQKRRLRTSINGNAHPYMRLTSEPNETERIRQKLIELERIKPVNTTPASDCCSRPQGSVSLRPQRWPEGRSSQGNGCRRN